MAKLNGQKLIPNHDGHKPQGTMSLYACDDGVELGVTCEKCGHHTVLLMQPDQADELSTDIRSRSIDVRRGGHEG